MYNSHPLRETIELGSRLLKPNLDTNDYQPTTTHPSPPRAFTDEEDESSGIRIPTEERPPHHRYERLETIEAATRGVDPSVHVFWRGNPLYALTWDFLSVFISILFLILGAFVVNLKDQPQSDWSRRIIQATQIAPSVWPVLFSGVLGNAVRRFADWRVERGVPLLALEQLMGSLTLAGSVISIFTWSIFQLSSVTLIVLWAFNPLGSQASFRGIYLRDSVGSGTGEISYYNHNLTNQLGLTMFQAGSTRSKPTVRALYSAALYDVISSTQYVDPTNSTFRDVVVTLGGDQAASVEAAMDSWGNLRIPNINHLSNFDPANPHQWITTAWMESVQNYSSLIGDSIQGVNRNFTGNTTFNITSSFQTLDCSPWSKFNQTQAERWAMDTFGSNMSSIMLRSASSGRKMSRTFFVASSAGKLLNQTSPEHPELIFGSQGSDTYMSITQCLAGTTYVDARVSCVSKGTLGKTNCGVSAMRKTLQPTDPDAVSLLEASRIMFPNTTGVNHNPLIPASFLQGFMDILDDVQVGSGVSSVVEWYLQDPLSALTSDASTMTFTELSNVDVKTVEKRLGLLYNTFWKASWSYASARGGNLTTSSSFDTRMNVTSRITFPLEPVYALSLPWIILYFVSVGVMFFAALFALIVHTRCYAPPVLGYMSSLVRDSVYFNKNEKGNSTEDGMQKAKRLANVCVRLADTGGEEQVGKIAFIPAHTGVQVKKRRWYR